MVSGSESDDDRLRAEIAGNGIEGEEAVEDAAEDEEDEEIGVLVTLVKKLVSLVVGVVP